METKWASGDAINLFHASAGTTTYVDDKQFTLDATRDGVFTGTLTSELTEGAYDWYAIYPYEKVLTTPANNADTKKYIYVGGRSDTPAEQKGKDSMGHLVGDYAPLYGVTKNVAHDERPSMTMQNLASVVAVKVTNTTLESIDVSSVSFTSTESLVGTFYVDITGNVVKYVDGNFVSSTASLKVTDASLASNESATFYIPVKPHTAASGAALKLSVNGYEKSIPLTKDITFTAGKIKTLNFNFDKVVIDYVTLPWSIDGTDGSSVWKNSPGLSQNGLGSDYKNKPYLTKFDTTGDFVQIKFDSSASSVKFSVKGNGNSGTSAISVMGSVNGSDFVEVEKFSITSGEKTFTTSNVIDESYRYIQLFFTKSDGMNAGLGAVEITKNSTDPYVSAENILGVSARGVENQSLAYTIGNAVDGAELSAKGDDVIVDASVSAGEVIYNVKPNTASQDRTGTITLTYTKDGAVLAEKEVNIQQLAPVFNVSRASVELDSASGSKTTITVTSDFDWMADASASAGFTFTPDTYTWEEGGKETVTITASSANSSESGTATLGTIAFSNMETSETIVVTVKQKSSYVAPSTGNTVTITFDGGQGQQDGLTWESVPIKVVANKSSGNDAPYEHAKDKQLRFYKGNTLSISGATITKVEFSGTVKKLSANDGTVTTDGKSWSGSSTNLILTNVESAQAKYKSITITYETL